MLLLYQEQNGFLFNSDSHYLYDFIAGLNPRGEMLDVGSGCGILGLLLARDFRVSLTSIDVQKNSCFLTKQNSAVNSIMTDVLEGDFVKYQFDKRFDWIVSNPPYYHDNVIKSENTKLNISRYESSLKLKDFIKKSNSILKPKGHLVFCYDAKRVQDIFCLLKEFKLNPVDVRFVYGGSKKQSHLVFVHARKSSNSPTVIHPPLIASERGEFTDEVKEIYKKTNTYSIKF